MTLHCDIRNAPSAAFELKTRKPLPLRDLKTLRVVSTLPRGRHEARARVRRTLGREVWFTVGDAGLPRAEWLKHWHDDAIELRRFRRNGWEDYFNVRKDALR